MRSSKLHSKQVVWHNASLMYCVVCGALGGSGGKDGGGGESGGNGGDDGGNGGDNGGVGVVYGKGGVGGEEGGGGGGDGPASGGGDGWSGGGDGVGGVGGNGGGDSVAYWTVPVLTIRNGIHSPGKGSLISGEVFIHAINASIVGEGAVYEHVTTV